MYYPSNYSIIIYYYLTRTKFYLYFYIKSISDDLLSARVFNVCFFMMYNSSNVFRFTEHVKLTINTILF